MWDDIRTNDRGSLATDFATELAGIGWQKQGSPGTVKRKKTNKSGLAGTNRDRQGAKQRIPKPKVARSSRAGTASNINRLHHSAICLPRAVATALQQMPPKSVPAVVKRHWSDLPQGASDPHGHDHIGFVAIATEQVW
jgi:hypothetical protein